MATVNALRKKFEGKINKINRVDLLEYMLQLSENEEDVVSFQLSGDKQNAVAKGIDQYKNGQFISDEDADKEVTQWLKKYSGPAKLRMTGKEYLIIGLPIISHQHFPAN